MKTRTKRTDFGQIYVKSKIPVSTIDESIQQESHF